MINTIAVQGYRSLRELRVPLSTITVVTGANGTGKSSLYRALRLLADCAEGQVVASLAREGGLPSTLWAGPEVIGKAVRSGEYEVQGTPQVRTGQPAAGLRGGGLLLSDRSRHPHAQRVGVQPRPGDQARAGLERRDPAAGHPARTAQARAGRAPRRSGLGAGRPQVAQSRVGADRGDRPGPGARAALGPRAGAVVAVLRPLPDRSRGAGPADADRHPYAGAAPRRPGPGRGPADHHRDRRFGGAGRHDQRRLPPVVAVGARGCRPVRPAAQRPRAAPPARGGRAVGWHAALSAAGGGAAQPAAPGVDGAQRAGDQPAPRPAGAPGPADRAGQRGYPDRGGVPLGAVDPRAAGPAGHPARRADQGFR